MDKHERIEKAFRCFCDYMDGEGLKYEEETDKDGDKRFILGFAGEAYDVGAVFVFEEDAERIYIGSVLPLTFDKEREDELLLAVLKANRIVAGGTFCVDCLHGQVRYESNETLAGVGAFEPAYAGRMIATVFSIIKRFCGQFAAVIAGTRPAEDITALSDEEDEEEA